MTALRLAAAALVVLAAAASVPTDAVSRSSGASPGFAGDLMRGSSPQTCAVSGCHATFELNSGSGAVTLDAPDTVAPGETVRLTVTVDNQTAPASGGRRQGFELAVRDLASGDHVGAFTSPGSVDAGTRFAGAGASDTLYVTHNLAGNEQTTWTVEWTAPSDAPAAVRVYVAGNAANGNGSASGDYIYATTADIALSSVAVASPPPLAFDLGAPSPNPVRDTGRLALVLDAPTRVAVRLVDGRGREVRSLADRSWTPGTHTLAVPVDALAPGLYFVVARSEAGTRTQPLVVVR